MKSKVIMPQLGESVVEGTVSKWLKRKGERVEEYEPLLEVSTDKVDTEVPAPASGVVLNIYVDEGETVEAGTLLAEIGEPGAGDSADDAPALREQRATGNGHHHEVKQANAASASSGHVTPVVARMVAEHDIDLAQVEGTGRGGRVTKRDVEAYLEGQGVAESTAPEVPAWEQPMDGDLFKPTVEYGQDDTPAKAAAPPQPKPATAPRPHPVEPVPNGTPGELVALTPLRKSIAEHMVRSKLETAPHVTTVFEVDMTATMAHRTAHLDDFARQGVNLTLTAYFAAATVAALSAHPYLNAQWRSDGIFLHHPIHLGIAVAVENGLIVPVIKNAQDLNLMGIARAVNDVAVRAREKRLKPDDVQGGTFTISNHGVSGSLFATPIINQPQVGILGVGIIEKRVKVIDDMIAVRPCCYLSLTFDHRVADGAAADGFMMTLKQQLEQWA